VEGFQSRRLGRDSGFDMGHLLWLLLVEGNRHEFYDVLAMVESHRTQGLRGVSSLWYAVKFEGSTASIGSTQPKALFRYRPRYQNKSNVQESRFTGPSNEPSPPETNVDFSVPSFSPASVLAESMVTINSQAGTIKLQPFAIDIPKTFTLIPHHSL
jgi:hypothetical protein